MRSLACGKKSLREYSHIVFVALAVGVCLFGQQALAADHLIPADVSTFNGSDVRPGDTVTLAAGERGPLRIIDLQGTSRAPIIVRNDPNGRGPAVIRREQADTGGFVFVCRNCEHVEIDGTGKWSGAPSGAYCGVPAGTSGCGIKVTSTRSGDSPSAYLRISGSSKNIVIRGIEVDGQWPSISRGGIGVSVNDHNYNRSEHAGEWRENIRIEKNFVHHVEGECLYVGPNWEYGGSADDLRLRNVEIAENLVTDCGWDGINVKSAIEGVNVIRHNIIRRAGRAADQSAGQHDGIAFYESGYGVIHHNLVEDSGETGITHFLHRMPESVGVMTSEIYNNVVVNSGVTGPNPGKGISVSRNKSAAQPRTEIYNNTIVDTEDDGIFVGPAVATSSVVRDNIVAGAQSEAVLVSRSTTAQRNLTGEKDAMGFVDAGRRDFRLREGSPAVDSADGPGSPVDDFAGVARPQGPTPDRGAYELIASGDPAVPASGDPAPPKPPAFGQAAP